MSCLFDVAQKLSVSLLTCVSTCLAQLVISNRAACASVVDNRGIDLIILLLKVSIPEVSQQVRWAASPARVVIAWPL